MALGKDRLCRVSDKIHSAKRPALSKVPVSGSERDYGLYFGFRGLLEEDGLRWESEVARLDRPVKSDGERGVVKQSTRIGLSH